MWPKIWFNVRINLQVNFKIGEFDFFKPNNGLKYRSLRFGGGNGWFALFKVTETTGWFISETEHTLFWVSLCSKFWAMWPVSVRKKDGTLQVSYAAEMALRWTISLIVLATWKRAFMIGCDYGRSDGMPWFSCESESGKWLSGGVVHCFLEEFFKGVTHTSGPWM